MKTSSAVKDTSFQIERINLEHNTLNNKTSEYQKKKEKASGRCMLGERRGKHRKKRPSNFSRAFKILRKNYFLLSVSY